MSKSGMLHTWQHVQHPNYTRTFSRSVSSTRGCKSNYW